MLALDLARDACWWENVHVRPVRESVIADVTPGA